MQRSAHLLAVMEREEIKMISDPIYQRATAEEFSLLLTNTLRSALARILAEQHKGMPCDDDAIDARIAQLELENLNLKRAARRNDFSSVELDLRNAAKALGIDLPAAIPNDLGRRTIELIRELKDVEGQVLDGEDAHSAAAPLVARFTPASVEEFTSSRPVLLSQAWDRALQLHPTRSMKGNIDAIANVTLAYFGDVPVAAITKQKQEAFFAWMARLPKKHGRSHGKNRHTEKARDEGRLAKETRQLCKQHEIDKADAADRAITDEIRAIENISDLEKRALLNDRLEPRMTITTLRRNRDGLNRLFKAAIDLGCHDVPAAISYKDVERVVAVATPNDPLYIRVTQPKIRMPWTQERLAKLLTSPIYTGCASPHRRWRPGQLIIRDAFYWVPLIVLTIGSRIEEILLLKQSGLLLRNSVYCLALGLDCDATGKTPDAERVVPIPQLLLDLGFVDWIKSRDQSHGPLLFPDIARRTTKGKVTEAFGKAFKIMLGHLGLADFDEDFYAMRKTLSSMLRDADVTDGQRQALAGHKSGTIINRHYTAHNTKKLKQAVDKANFELDISNSDKHGHPIITGCSLGTSEPLAVEVVLNDTGEADVIRVSKKGIEDYLFIFERGRVTKDKKLAQEAIQNAARKFSKIVGENPLNLPRNRLKRSAIEHFHALG
jgi:integrase